MLQKLPTEIVENIIFYLNNMEIFKFVSTNNLFISLTKNQRLKLRLILRYHPLVINICDNFCRQCNWVSIKKIISIKEFLHCHHY